MSRHHRRTHNREWARIRDEVLDRDGWRCQNPDCGKAGALEVHHVVELQDGGTNDLGNLTTRCRSCHIDAHRPTLTAGQAEWERMVKELG